VRARGLQRKLESESREQLGKLRETQFASAPVFKRLKRSAAEARSSRKRRLAKLQFSAVLADLLANGIQVKHVPNILGNPVRVNLFA